MSRRSRPAPAPVSRETTPAAGELAELRELVRQAHETIKDGRAVIRELREQVAAVKAAIDETPASIHQKIREATETMLARELERWAPDMREAMAHLRAEFRKEVRSEADDLFQKLREMNETARRMNPGHYYGVIIGDESAPDGVARILLGPDGRTKYVG